MNAKERFNETRKAVSRLDDVRLMIMNGCEDWKPPTVGKSGNLDPTANKAIYNADELEGKIKALKSEAEELEDFIGVSLALIAAVRTWFGEVYAILLERRFIDGETWARIHEDCGIAKSTGHYLLEIAFDWIDSVGVSRIMKGDVEL